MSEISEFTRSYLKWRYLLNSLPIDNATLKIYHHGASRSAFSAQKRRGCKI